ncbi:MAG: hypothetical protein SFW08_01560 [Gemmatimonadaceae bacterium]|nr:hypothetical protein [Gemmatimonadaceae bacterium]
MPAKKKPAVRKTTTKSQAKAKAKAKPASTRKPAGKAAAKSTRRTAPQPSAKPKPITPGWALVEPLIIAGLQQMKRDQFLVLACTDANRFVQFAVQGPGRIRGEVVSDHFLEDDERLSTAERASIAALGWKPPTHADDAPAAKVVKGGSPNWFADFAGPAAARLAARAAVQTLAGAFKHSPPQVRYHAFAKDGEELTLPLTGILPEEEWMSPGFRPDDHDDLREMVVDTLRGAELGATREVEGVDLAIDVGDRTVFVTANDEPFSVLIYSVVGALPLTEETLATVNDLNRSRQGSRAIIYEDHLLVDRVIPAEPFVPRQLVDAVVELAGWANAIASEGSDGVRAPADPVVN